MTKVNQFYASVSIHQAIGGMIFPATKKEIIEYARNRGAGDGIIDTLQNLPHQVYRSEAGIIGELSRHENSE
jgi:hypothetical protein